MVAFWFEIIYHLALLSPKLYLFCKMTNHPCTFQDRTLCPAARVGTEKVKNKATEVSFSSAVGLRVLGAEEKKEFLNHVSVGIGDSGGKGSACNAGDLGSIPGLGNPLEKGMATHSSILAGEFHGQRSLAGCSAWGQKESNSSDSFTFQGLNTHLLDTGVPALVDLLFLFCTCLHFLV